MMIDIRAARRTFDSYAGTGPRVRAFVAGRLAVAGLGPLGAELRQLEGRVLSLGCGYAVIERYLAELNYRVSVDGIELDEQRVRVAKLTRHRCPRVSVRQGDATALATGRTYAAAILFDLMHHLPPGAHLQVASLVRRHLEPGGICLVKDIALSPAWQYRWNRLHDRLVAGPDPIHCRSPDEMATIFQQAGLVADGLRRVARFNPYPHYVVRLNRAG